MESGEAVAGASLVDDSTIENLQNTVVAKSLVWTDGDDHYYMLILDAMRRVDASKLAAVVPDKTLSIADREMAELITKQKVGTIGPFHQNSERLTIIVDENLILLDPAPSVLVGSGRPGFSYRVSSPASLVEICHAQVYPLTDMKAPPSARSRHFGGFSGKSNKSVDLMSYSIGSEHPSTKSDDSIFEYLEPSSVKSLESDLTDVVASPKGATMCHRKDEKDFEEVVFSPQLLRKVAISSDTVKLLAVIDAAKRGRFHPQYHFPSDYSVADHLNLPSKVGGKTAFHLATWKGALENVRVLLDHGAALNQWSTNEGNYGKTAIFYSITQARDDVVLLLLAYGARVTIINNKGQSPRSLGASHLQEATIQAIEEAEALQISSYFYQHQPQQQQQQHEPIDNSPAFLNFYTPEYRNPQESCFGDLDPRFADEAIDLRASVHNDWKQLPRSLNPTAAGARRSTRSNQTFMYSHMFQESFLFPSNESAFPDDAASASSSASSSSSGVANEIVADVSTNEVTLRGLIVSKRQVSQTLIFANLAPLGHSDFSSLKDVLYSWHRKEPPVASMEANGGDDDGPAATTAATATGTQVEETFAVQLILGKSLRETYGESLLRELGKYLREGQRVEVVGEIRAISEAKRWSLFHSSNPDAPGGSTSDHAQYKDIDFAVQRIRIAPVTASSSSSSSSTDDTLSAQARDELRWQEKLQELRGPSHVQLPTTTTTRTTGRNQNVLKTNTAALTGGKPPAVPTTAGRDDGHSTVSEALLPPMPPSTASAAETTTALSPASSLVSRKAQRKLQLERYAAEQKARAMEIKAALSRGDVPFWSLALATQLLAHPNPSHFLESCVATDATTTINRPMDTRDKEDDYKHDGVQPAIPALLVHDAASVELFLEQVRSDFIAAGGRTSSSVNNNNHNDGGASSSLLASKQQPGQDEGNETSEIDEFVSFNEAEARQQWVPSTVYEYVVGIDCEWRPDGFYEKSPTQSPPMGDSNVNTIDLSPPTMDDADVFVVDNKEHHHVDPPSGTSKTSKIHFAASTSSLVGLEEASGGGVDNTAAVAPSGRKERGSSQRPSFVETLQLATRHRVYVLDMPSLYANFEWRSKANEALAILFGDERVWKIGYDCAQDFQRLAVSYPGIPAFQRVHSIVDLLPLSKWLYPDVVNRQNSGLSKLCYSLFHRTLNKEQQTSTWHLRPFTPQQLEYAALDAAILLVAFNQMAHDYHVHPVSVASQSHKRRLAQNAISSPPQRSFRHYIETMGILYHVKFQIYHEDAWDPSLLLSFSSSSSPSSSVVQSDGTTPTSTTPTTTTTANPLMLLSRLQEILEIVDVRRKKHLQIQTQLTRHVAVLKYHRHYQDKEFPPLDKLIDMLLAPSTSPQSLSGSSSVVGSARVPVFTATTAVDNNMGSSNEGSSVGFPISASESSTPSLEFHKNMRSSKATKKELRALKKSKKANQEAEMKELDAKLRGIALHDLMSDNGEDDGEGALPLPAPAEDVRQVTPKESMIPALSNRLHLSLPEATLFPTTMSPRVPGNNVVVASHNGGDSTVLPVGVKEASSGPLNWLSTIGTYVGRNSEDCLHMIYRTLYLPRDPQLIKLSPNLMLHTSPSTRPPPSSTSSSASPPPPKIERLGGYMFLMQESVLMFVNTLSDASSGGSMSSKPSSVSLSQMATTTTMTSSKVSTTSTSFLSESMKYVNVMGISSSNSSELNEFDNDGAAFTFVFPMGDLARLLGSSSPVLRGLKGVSSPSTTAATTSQKATTTTAAGGGTEGVSTVKKRIFHLFVRERKKPYLYCGTCYPVKAITLETNTPSDESDGGAAAAATMAKVKFQLLYFQDGPQPLSLHEDYQRILLEHTMELTKRYAKEQLMSERASIHIPPVTTKHPPVHHGAVPVPVPVAAAAASAHVAVANVHGHIKASEIDRPEHVHAANLPDRNKSIHGLKVPINDTVGVAFPEAEEEEEMAFGDWSHSVKLSRHNSNAQKPPVVLPSEPHFHVAKKHHVTLQENNDTRK